jgi:hypothetical protein
MTSVLQPLGTRVTRRRVLRSVLVSISWICHLLSPSLNLSFPIYRMGRKTVFKGYG